MIRPHGYVTIAHPESRTIERDAVSCRHCQRIVFVKPGTVSTVYLEPQQDGTWKETPGAFCRCCMAPICLRCEAQGVCTPFLKQIEAAEARQRLRAAVTA
jgi:hypothetical protein